MFERRRGFLLAARLEQLEEDLVDFAPQSQVFVKVEKLVEGKLFLVEKVVAAAGNPGGLESLFNPPPVVLIRRALGGREEMKRGMVRKRKRR